MEFNTTDGKTWRVPDMCAHCQLDTAGNHQEHCPTAHTPNYIMKKEDT